METDWPASLQRARQLRIIAGSALAEDAFCTALQFTPVFGTPIVQGHPRCQTAGGRI